MERTHGLQVTFFVVVFSLPFSISSPLGYLLHSLPLFSVTPSPCFFSFFLTFSVAVSLFPPLILSLSLHLYVDLSLLTTLLLV